MTDTVFVVARLWLRPGRVAAFEDYERRAARIMARHGGRIEKAVRSAEAADEVIEVHLLRFPSMAAFTAYRSDAELAALAAQRDAAIARTEVFVGHEAPGYAG